MMISSPTPIMHHRRLWKVGRYSNLVTIARVLVFSQKSMHLEIDGSDKSHTTREACTMCVSINKLPHGQDFLKVEHASRKKSQ